MYTTIKVFCIQLVLLVSFCTMAYSGTVSLKWRAVTGAKAYVIQHLVGETFVDLITVTTLGHTLTISDDRQHYCWRVIAVYANGERSGYTRILCAADSPVDPKSFGMP